MTKQQAGVLGGRATGKRNRAKTHCPYGHPYSSDNLYVVPKTGFRQCRTCQKEQHKLRTGSSSGRARHSLMMYLM